MGTTTQLRTGRPLPAMVRQKVVPPGLPATAIARPRLDALYARLLDEHEALAVFATAGSGKTVQAQMFASRQGWPLAWLTLDGADRSPSRMLSYLAGALRQHVPNAQSVLESAFASEPVPEVVAALLAEAVAPSRLLIVFDQCEAIADSPASCSVLEAFLDYLPASARALLLSREEMGFSLGRMLLHERVGRITDEDLAVSADEAQSFLRARDDDTDVDACLQRTRGWFAAVAFGVSRRPSSHDRSHDRSRDFGSYVAAEVFDVLDPHERQFLLDTSILDAVTVRGAVALCGSEARAMWRQVGMRHLPATTSADGTIVYHPCFRQFLRERLELTDIRRLGQLRRAHAQLLLETAHYEDAAEILLESGNLDDAVPAVERACGALVDRCDWDTVLRWAQALGPERADRSPVLLGAVIPALRGTRRLAEARELIRELHADGRLADTVATDERVITHVAWSMLWQPREGLDLLDRYDATGRAAGARYMLEVTSGEDPVASPHGIRWADVDRLVSWGLMVQGRLDDLVAMLPSEDQWPPRTPYTTPHPLLGLVWRGELGRARELFDQVPEEVKRRIHTDLWHYLESWLLLAEGHPQDALVASQRAIVHSRRTCFGFEPVFQVVEAEALLSLGRVDDAVAVLGESIESSRSSGLRAYEEWGQAMLGRALLLNDEDDAAATLLASCVESMARAHRLLLLPAAATFLAEANRRLGRPEAMLAAAESAHEASVRMDAFFVLSRALERFPALGRVLEHGADATKWRLAGTRPALTARSRDLSRENDTVVLIQPFGSTPDILVDGRSSGVHRLKMLELASFLAARPNGVARDEVLTQLFPDSDRRHAGNHFRQVVHQLRKTAGLGLQRLPTAQIAWSEALRVDAVDRQFERNVAQAHTRTGEARLTALCDALDLVTGSYLQASELEWVSDRRFELEVTQEEAELETARLALKLHDLDRARALAERLLARNRYSEAAYRTLIEIDLAVGSETSALGTYRRALSALREIGLAPGEPTARLLRGTPARSSQHVAAPRTRAAAR